MTTATRQLNVTAKDAARFWRYAGKADDASCWEWSSHRDPLGYGRMSLGGESAKAHRIAWVIATGRLIPAGMHVLHRCDYRACVNPAHLFLGTHGENMLDMVAKGRDSGLRAARSAARASRLSRTHCKNGHPYSAENTIRTGARRVRRCRICVDSYRTKTSGVSP